MTRTTSTTPDNALVVSTNTGFATGDLIYYRGATNDYAPLSALPATGPGNFDYVETTGLMSNGVGAAVLPVFGSTTGTTNPATSGGSAGQFAAVLTNGNIVQVFVSRTTARVNFQIVDTTGAVVVASTEVNASFLQSVGRAGVVALTGGGFAVFWINSSGGTPDKPCYAVYSNTGSVVTAAINDTTFSNTTNNGLPITGVALPNGGFALAALENTAVPWFRAFTSTGVGSYAWTSASNAAASNEWGVGIGARSDSSIILVFYSNTTSVRYQIRAANSGLSVNATFSTGTTSNFSTSVTTLTDGTTFVIGYQTIAFNAFRFLPTGNTLGAEVLISNANVLRTGLNNGQTNSFVSLLSLSTGGFAFAFTDYTLAIQYAVYDSAGNPLSGTNSNGTLPRFLPSTRVPARNTVTLLQYGGNLNFFWSSAPPGVPSNQNWARASLATYNPVYVSSSSQLVGAVPATMGAAVVSTAAPTSSRFFAANTENIPFTGSLPAASAFPAATVITAAACRSIASATLPNGRVLIAYHRTSDDAVFVAVYSITMVLEQTISVATANSNNFYLKIAALANGGFVVGFFSAANTYTLRAYNSSFAFVGTNSIQPVSNANSTGVGLKGLSNGRFVVHYVSTSTSQTFYIVYDNTATTLVGPVSVFSVNSFTSCTVAADSSGGFCAFAYDGPSGQGYYSFYYNTTGTTYVQGNAAAGNSANSTLPNNTGGYSPGAGYFFGSSISSSSAVILLADNQSSTVPAASALSSIGNTSALSGVGQTGNGSLVFVGFSGTNSMTVAALPGGVGPIFNSVFSDFTLGASSRVTTNYTYFNTGTFAQPCVTSGQGYNAVIAWLDASAFPTFINVNVFPFQATAQITAGVSQTNTRLPIYPYTTSITPAVQNAVFAGVAGSSATANGTGVVLTKGLAQLNNNYSASTPTQSFDFQTPNGTGVPGVKGTITGRVVNLQGAE